MSARVVVMTKAPVPGEVKTRLIPPLTAEGAAALHGAMIMDTLDKVAASGLPLTVALAGDPSHPLIDRLRAEGFRIEPQQGADLGARLRHALRGPDRAIALGADCVCFSPAWLREAAGAGEPVSLGPAEDGGYWAIAVTPESRAVVFERISWSTRAVHAQTLARAEAAGLSVAPLPSCYDIDRPADLLRLIKDPHCPARTEAVLDSLLS
jgi:rSAM/selenodomain-associated transferase 1